MTVQTNPPAFPVGPFDQHADYDREAKTEFIQILSDAPGKLRQATFELDNSQLDTKYKNWSVRQIVHHVADSHLHSYIRFKWALTEDSPVIKAYDESVWSNLDEAKTGPIEPSLNLLTGLHERWLQLIRSMTDDDFQRTFIHPDLNETVPLSLALSYYAWHSRHHTGQILWLRDQHGWK